MAPKAPPPKFRPQNASKDPTPSDVKTVASPVVLPKINEANSMDNQSPVASKKKIVKKVVKVVVKKLVKKRVPKVSLNKQSELVESSGDEGIGSGCRGIDGIREMGSIDSGVGGNGSVKNVEKIDSSELNSGFGGESCDFGGNLCEEGNSGVILGLEREERNKLTEHLGNFDSSVLNSVVDRESCDFGGNSDNGGSVSEEIRNSRVVKGFEREEVKELGEDRGKVDSLSSDSAIIEGIGGSAHVGKDFGLVGSGMTDEVGKIGSNSVPQSESCDVGVSMLTEGGFPVEVQNSGGMDAMAVDERGKVDSSVLDLVGDDKVCDHGAMEVENMGIVGTSEAGKEEFMGGGHVNGEKDERWIVKSEFPGEKSTESEDFVEGKSVEIVKSGEHEVDVKEEVDKSSYVITGNVGTVLSGEFEALERRRRRKTEIFIGGVDKNATKDDVRIVFEQFGEVIEVRMWTNEKTGRNKGYAFVRFASAEDAKKALETSSNVQICGKQCSITPVEGNDTIFLGNINKEWKNDDVIKLLKDIEIEKIDKVTLMVDPKNAERNRGFAFIEFETSIVARAAFKKLHEDFQVKLQKLKVAWAEPLNEPDEEELQKVKAIFVEYLPSSWNEEKLKKCFKRFGEIENVVLARNLHSSKRKDFAFVNFVTREAALACIESFSHGMVDDEGTEVNVKVSFAKPLPKGKSLKKASMSASQEISKQKSKALERIAKPTQPRNKGRAKAELTCPIERGNNRGPANQITIDRAIDMKARDRVVDARPSHRVVDMRTSHRVVDAKTSQSIDLEQILAERAFQRQMQSRLGLTNSSHSTVSPGTKRLFSASVEDLYNPESRRHIRMRVDDSFPIGSDSMLAYDPFHPAPREHTHLHAESSVPVVNRNLQSDYLYHPDARRHIHKYVENSFPVISPKRQADDLIHPDHSMYPRVGAETGADNPYRHEPRRHALMHGEKSFLGKNSNLQEDELLHRGVIGHTRMRPHSTLLGGSLGRGEAPTGFGGISLHKHQSPDYAFASDYRGRDYTGSFQRDAPIGGSSSNLHKRWMK